MQFLWKYIDDLVGKGLESSIIIELLWYSSITLIPIALPLSILLASMMVMGGMAERSEITALNSLGQPFIYITKPLLLFSLIIAITSFTISNYAIPYANLKATNLMYDIMQKKLSINIQEKVFFSEIEGYSIRVNKKRSDGIMQDVIIYDYTSKKGVSKVFIAKSAKMAITNDNNYLIIELYDGESYNEVTNSEDPYLLNTTFNKYSISLDLSSFHMERTTSDRFSNRAKTMNIQQLNDGIDSLTVEKAILKTSMLSNLNSYQQNKGDRQKNILINQMLNNINKKIRDFTNYKNQQLIITKKINKFSTELHRKFTLALACIIMAVIGACIGTIIKKGGFGLPVVFSIILFLVYHVMSITGEKMVKKDVLDPAIGMWFSTYIMIIVSIILIIIVNNNYWIKRT